MSDPMEGSWIAAKPGDVRVVHLPGFLEDRTFACGRSVDSIPYATQDIVLNKTPTCIVCIANTGGRSWQ